MPTPINENPPPFDVGTGPRTARATRAHLLLAEDDADFRTLLQRSFVKHGFEVTTACDGFELYRILAHSLNGQSPGVTYAVVVADLHMPRWSGLGVLALVGCDSHTPPMVIITAFGSDDLREQAKQLGAAAVLERPLDLDDLCSLVDRLAERRIVRAGSPGTA